MISEQKWLNDSQSKMFYMIKDFPKTISDQKWLNESQSEMFYMLKDFRRQKNRHGSWFSCLIQTN